MAWSTGQGEKPGSPRKVDYNVMSERNYACDDLILTFFGNASVAALDEVRVYYVIPQVIYSCTTCTMKSQIPGCVAYQ